MLKARQVFVLHLIANQQRAFHQNQLYSGGNMFSFNEKAEHTKNNRSSHSHTLNNPSLPYRHRHPHNPTQVPVHTIKIETLKGANIKRWTGKRNAHNGLQYRTQAAICYRNGFVSRDIVLNFIQNGSTGITFEIS